MIHRKKNDLLYKAITCLCHSLARLWVLCLMVLFLLGLGFSPSYVLGVSSVWFMTLSTEMSFLIVLVLFSNWRVCFLLLLDAFFQALS